MCFLLLCGSLACGGSDHATEVAYVSAPETFLRDRIAPIFTKVATVHRLDKVEVLDRKRRFVLVRTDQGKEGWLHERYLVSGQVYEVATKLPQTTRSMTVQGRAVTRATTNIHIVPSRDSDHLYQLKQGETVDVLKRAAVPKTSARTQVLTQQEKDEEPKDVEANEPPPLPMEDWLLVRGDSDRVGWVLARMVYMDVPLDVAQYAGGDRIVAYFVLNHVQDDGKSVPQYLLLLSGSGEGSEFDYDQARVFTWNVKRHRYETAYRERKLNGVLPARVETEDSGREGQLPVFILPVKDQQDHLVERRYELIGPIVRRITTPAVSSHLSNGAAAKHK